MSSMRVALLAHRGREAADADRAAAELLDDRPQQPAIDLVEPVLVHLEQLQRALRRRRRVIVPSARTCA